MRKSNTIVALVFVLLICSLKSFAQIFTSETDKFSAWFPQEPRRHASTIGEGLDVRHYFQSDSKTPYRQIIVTDLPRLKYSDKMKSKIYIELRNKFVSQIDDSQVREYKLLMTKDANICGFQGRVVKESFLEFTWVTIPKMPSRFQDLETEFYIGASWERRIKHQRLFIKESKLYSLSISVDETDNEHSTIVKKFFDSFKLLKTIDRADPNVLFEMKDARPASRPGRGTGGGSVTNGGTADADSSRRAASNQVEPSKVEQSKCNPSAQVGITPLRITSQPKPLFTDEARKADTQGIVSLRVIFLETGQIGNISVIQGLPNGLTENAISAAKRIKFEPEKLDCVPRMKRMVLNYSFTFE
jgi:Gram-negative bacterial TonB protein C-terminal